MFETSNFAYNTSVIVMLLLLATVSTPRIHNRDA